MELFGVNSGVSYLKFFADSFRQGYSRLDIAGRVAAMTESDSGVGVKKLIDNSISG